MSDPTVDVIVVDFNAGSAIRTCVNSVLHSRQTRWRLGRVRVVDNASQPPTRELLCGIGQPVVLLRNDANKGFACACNQGARGSSADYLLFVNPDIAASADAIESSVEFMESSGEARAGIVGVQLRSPQGDVQRTCSEFPRPGHFWNKALGLDRLWPRACSSGPMAWWNHMSTRSVDQVMGAFFLVRRRLFERLGGFDERFFVYFEEVDFSLRAKQAGIESVFLATAWATHTGNVTTEVIRDTRLFYSWRSRLAYAGKHFTLPGRASVATVTLVVEPIFRISRALARGNLNEGGEAARAWARIWRQRRLGPGGRGGSSGGGSG